MIFISHFRRLQRYSTKKWTYSTKKCSRLTLLILLATACHRQILWYCSNQVVNRDLVFHSMCFFCHFSINQMDFAAWYQDRETGSTSEKAHSAFKGTCCPFAHSAFKGTFSADTSSDCSSSSVAREKPFADCFGSNSWNSYVTLNSRRLQNIDHVQLRRHCTYHLETCPSAPP